MDGRVERRTRTEGRPIKGQSLSINMKNYLSVYLVMTRARTHTRAHTRARVRQQEQVDLQGSSDGIFGGINRDLAWCNDI